MKVIIQRVSKGCIKVNEEIISSIGRGLLVLVGISKNDTKEDLDYITKKILSIRFFDDENGKKWSKNVKDKQFEILCMSQFTLCYNLKGNKLDFHHAMSPGDAIKFYENFLDSLKSQYKPELVKSGKFGAYCQVEFSNDGPVTINLESKRSETESDVKEVEQALQVLWNEVRSSQLQTNPGVSILSVSWYSEYDEPLWEGKAKPEKPLRKKTRGGKDLKMNEPQETVTRGQPKLLPLTPERPPTERHLKRSLVNLERSSKTKRSETELLSKFAF